MTRFLPALFALLFLGAVLAEPAQAQGSFFPKSENRADRWEGSLSINRQDGEFVGGEEDAFIDFRSDTGFAFGVGYNFTNHFALSGDFIFNSPRYDGEFTVDEDGDGEPDGTQQISHKADFFTAQLRGTWNILEGPFTPFLEGSIGTTYVDSNVTDRPPVTGCWWDPWWGYICRPFYSTYSDWNLSYGWGAGLRMDFNVDFGARLTYSQRYLDLSNSSDPSFSSLSADFIWRF